MVKQTLGPGREAAWETGSSASFQRKTRSCHKEGGEKNEASFMKDSNNLERKFKDKVGKLPWAIS